MQMSTMPYRRTAAAAFAALLLAACSDPMPTGPVGARLSTPGQAPAHDVMPASVEWNEIARAVIMRNRSNVFVAFRTYALVSVAQERAMAAVAAAPTTDGHPSLRAAIASASVAVLGSLFPNEVTWLAMQYQQRIDSGDWLELGRVDLAAGEALGRAAGLAVYEHAKTDGYADAWTGTIPAPGDGVWWSNGTAPGGASVANARTYFLASPDQFRPDAPPAFGSAEFLADLDEVRRFAAERNALTPEGRMMDSIAKFWAMGAGSYTPPGYWNDVASRLAMRYSLNEQRSTHLLALLNMVAMDAIIASNDAKYEYWLLRPSQADPTITLSITPLPNFPAYPSNHATISAAMAEVLALEFPSEADWLRAAADQAALSRVYGGIHFRFDGEVGLELGRTIAQYAVEQSFNAAF
jgi:hypothetical protein